MTGFIEFFRDVRAGDPAALSVAIIFLVSFAMPFLFLWLAGWPY